MVKIRVPATSANMGPGFDCLGVAVNMYNVFAFEEIENGLIIEGCADEFKNEENLIYVSMKKYFDKVNYYPKGIRIVIEGDIPVSRGLGSSAACVVGGIIGANELCGRRLSPQQLLELAVSMEGHPDNITPAFFGGVTVAVNEGQQVVYNKVDVKSNLKLVALIPDFTLSTEKARAVLPKSIGYKEAIFNIGRGALMISALTSGNNQLLKIACKDKLHEDYRAALVNNFYDIKEICNKLNCLATFLSGAGPTIMVMIERENDNFVEGIQKFLDTLSDRWVAREVEIDNLGAVIIND